MFLNLTDVIYDTITETKFNRIGKTLSRWFVVESTRILGERNYERCCSSHFYDAASRHLIVFGKEHKASFAKMNSVIGDPQFLPLAPM